VDDAPAGPTSPDAVPDPRTEADDAEAATDAGADADEDAGVDCDEDGGADADEDAGAGGAEDQEPADADDQSPGPDGTAADGDGAGAGEPEFDGEGETGAVAEAAAVDGGTDPVAPGVDELTDTGELDELAAVLHDGSDEPRRHWLRYPGLFGALTVVALVILVPCGAGILFFTGAFADPGAYGHAPDACARLTAQRVEAAFGAGLVRDYPSDTGDESSCTYLGGAASGRNARVTLTLTRYGTKGPLSAPRMAHAGFTSDLSGTRDRATLSGLGDEAARVTSDTGTTVLVRRSNLVLRLDASGDIEDPSRGVTSTARALVGSLR
jgi:hypothetical protein